jgi:hypothetical protein
MKRISVVVAAVALLGGASVGLAAAPPAAPQAIVLQPGQAVRFAGLTCTAYSGTTPTNANLVCVRNNLAGFGVVVSQQSIVVAKRMGSKLKVVFKTNNR